MASLGNLLQNTEGIMRNIAVLVLLFFNVGFSAHAEPLRVVFVSGSFEYDSDTCLEMFRNYLESNYEVDITFLKATDWDVLPGLEALDTCDVALFFTRRLTIKGEGLARVRSYVDAGRPIVALRTASHGFEEYLEFDAEVLGGNYKGHFGEGPTTDIGFTPRGREHPVLQGVGPLRSRYSLYKTKPVARDAETLMIGKTSFSDGWQPVSWVRVHNGGRVFYSSLGGLGDFEGDSFKRLIANALFWAARREPERKPMPELVPWERKTGVITVPLRSREQDTEKNLTRVLQVEKTAVLLCDMWDKHWCRFASDRVAEMAPRMNEVVTAARKTGMLIVHAPSETLGFYAENPARRRILEAPVVEPKEVKQVEEPKLPIDDSDGGCPDDDIQYGAWTRQQPAIEIHDADVISDDGRQIYSYLQQYGIDTILYMGVHTNMCVLGRSFGIRQMTRWGMNCILVRDMTDTMYNPAMPPKVPHDEGTELVVEHIEKYWAPTLISEDLLTSIKRKTP